MLEALQIPGLAGADPASWPSFRCTGCGHTDRRPILPEDGFCRRCAAKAAEAAAMAPDLEDRLRECGVPPRYRAFSRETWEAKWGPWAATPILKPLIGWTGGEGEGEGWLVLIFGSGYGQRKTGLGTALFRELVSRGVDGCWIDQSFWVRDLQAHFRSEGFDGVWRRPAAAGVTLIDDFGGVQGLQMQSGWWRREAVDLIRFRESNRLPTIVVANLTQWTDVGHVHQCLVSRMDVPLKIRIETGSKDFRRDELRREAV